MGSEFPADATGTGHSRGRCCPHSIPGLGGRGHTPRSSPSLETNAGSSLAAPFPFLPSSQTTSGLLLQPRLCPPPVSPCEVLGGAPGAQAGEAPSAVLCTALPTSGIFSPPPEAWKGPGQTGPFTHHPHHTPITIPYGGKKSKTKTNKKIFCTEIYFYYTKFVQYQKRKKKRCKFFFIIVGKR